eukprot:495211_1
MTAVPRAVQAPTRPIWKAFSRGRAKDGETYILWKSSDPTFKGMHISERVYNTHASYDPKVIRNNPSLKLEGKHYGRVNAVEQRYPNLKAIYVAFSHAYPKRVVLEHQLVMPKARVQYDDYYDYDAMNLQGTYTFGLDRPYNGQYLGNNSYNSSIEYIMGIIPFIILICVVFCLGCIISNICISVGCYMFGKTQKTNNKSDVIEYQQV